MTRLRILTALVFLALAAFVAACSGEEAAESTPVIEIQTVVVVATPTTVAVATPVPVKKGVPQPKNAAGTIVLARSIMECPQSTYTVACGSYIATSWGVGEDLFTWGWRDDGTIDYEVGQLAVGWEMAPDALSVVIETRDNVQFHKGWGKMTAEDVAFGYNQVNPAITPHSIAASASYLSSLMGTNRAVALDETHVEFKFTTVDSHWLSYMMNTNGFIGMLIHPKKAYDENGEEWLRENYIATGPFQVEEWTKGDRAVMTRFDDHWGFTPEVDKVIVLEIPEETSRVAGMQTGEIDSAELGIRQVPGLVAQGFAKASAGNANQAGLIFSGNLWETKHANTGEDLNTAGASVYVHDIPWIGNPFKLNDGNNPAEMECADGADPLADPAQSCGDMEQARLVRQAIGMAIDRDTINEVLLSGLSWPVHIPYADEKSEYWQTKWEISYNVAMANEYLDKAGYPRGSDGTRFEMPLFAETGQYGGLGPEIVDALSGMMAKIGIDSQVQKYPYAIYRPGLVGRTATIPRLTSGDDAQTTYPFDWPKGLEESSLSRGGYCLCYESPEISRIFLAVAAEPDEQKRIELSNQYFDYQAFWSLKVGVVAIPLFTTYNPNSIEEWAMEPSIFQTTAFRKIVPVAR